MQYRESNGRFGMKIRWFTWSVFFVLVFAFAGWVDHDYLTRKGELVYSAEEVLQETKDTTKEKLEEKIEQLKDEVVETLFELECAGCQKVREGQLKYTHDPRKVHLSTCQETGGIRPTFCDSWGIAQYKISTLVEHWRLVHSDTITEVEALAISQDNEKVRELVKKVIINHPGTIWAWTQATNNKEYFTRQISLIRELEDILAVK